MKVYPTARILFLGGLASLTLALSSATAQIDSRQEGADKAFTSGDWSAAAKAYDVLLMQDRNNPQNAFRYARALQETGDYEGALTWFEVARSTGFQATARIDYHMARLHAANGNPARALGHLSTMAETSGPIAGTVRNTAEFSTLADKPEFLAILEQLKPCSDPRHRQFDFWVGQWSVTPAGRPNGGAKSRIELIQNGCAVLENYNAGSFAGTSINFYDAKRDVWHQSWMSNTGNVFYAEGGLNEKGEMVLTDRDLDISTATGTINTVTWTPLESGGVRQHWQSSTDKGETWQTVFDGYYALSSSDG